MRRFLVAVMAAALMSSAALAQQGTMDAGTLTPEGTAHNAADYSPFVDRPVPDRVLWGDTHLHTSYSADAGFFGLMFSPVVPKPAFSKRPIFGN